MIIRRLLFQVASHPVRPVKPIFTSTVLSKQMSTPREDADVANPSRSGTTTEATKRIFAPGSTQSDGEAPSQAAQFSKGSLSPSDLSEDPLSQFHTWFTLAQKEGVYVPETCTLSTAELPSGRVSARMVYMKELDSKGFVVYSNFGTSRKSKDLETNKYASLVFWFREQERQIRVEGPTERLKDEESQVYYDTRIKGSRIGAWASQQSSVLKGREELEGRVKDVEKRFEGQDKIPVPPFWGGLRIVPEMMEFWQGRESRLHDRIRYTKTDYGWKKERLSP